MYTKKQLMVITKSRYGFTIVELLIVVVVIAILAAIVIVSYNGIQGRAREVKIQSDIKQVAQLIEAYKITHGEYPVTSAVTIIGGSTSVVAEDVYSDPGCSRGMARTDWVPGLDQPLPDGDNNPRKAVQNREGCYLYQSDGKNYILSAWNMLNSPQNTTMYRRIGFREMSNIQFYYCNQTNIGGNNPTPYAVERDYYKYSYTVTSIDFCNETPPAGA